jgi:hypothetical protein
MTLTVCRHPFDELVECVLSSSCVENENRSVRDCLHDKQVAEKCAAQRSRYFLCRKAAVDPKNRIHGSSFVKSDFQKEKEQESGKQN